MNKTVSDKIRYSYNLGAVMVLIMHCSGNLPVRDNWSYVVCKMVASAGVVCVPWFLFMAAYFLFRNYNGDYNGLLKKKTKTLLIPYIIWNSVGYFFRILVRNPINQVEERFSFKEFLKGFVPLHNADGAMWFIALLMLFVLLTPLFSKLISKRESGYFIIGIMSFLVAIDVTSANYWSILLYMPLYLFGGYIAVHYREVFENFIGGSQILTCNHEKIIVNIADYVKRFICGIFIYLCVLYAYHQSLISQNIYLYLAPFIFVLIMRIKLFPCKDDWFAKNGSFLIYASHGLFTNIICPNIYVFKKWSLSALGGGKNVIPAYFAVIIICMLLEVVILIVAWLFRYSRWIWVFTGGRN